MDKDLYLNVLISLYKDDKISYDLVCKKVSLYLKENKYSESDIKLYLDKNITLYELEKKKSYLSKILIGDKEPKYADILDDLSLEEIDLFYNNEKGITKEVVIPSGMEVSEPEVIGVVDMHEYENETTLDENHEIINDEIENKQVDDEYSNVEEYEKLEDLFIDANMSEEEIDESKDGVIDFDNIVNNVSKDEESKVHFVNVSAERLKKLKESKKNLNLERILVDIAIVSGCALILGPLVAAVGTGTYAVIRTLIKHNKFKPKTKIGNWFKDSIEKITNKIDEKVGPVVKGGMSK